MPRVPFRYNRRSHRRGKAAGSIQKAWRKRNRRKKGGLVVRTAQSNRRAIRAIKKNTEVKVLEDTNAIGPLYQGQYFTLDAGTDGRTTLGIEAIVSPWCGMAQGTAFDQRVGDWVTMHSLTYKIQVDCENINAPLAAESNRVGCLIVIDRDPDSVAPNLNNGGTTVSTPGTLLHNLTLQQLPYLSYQDLNNCGGPEARYKVLRHLKGTVQQQKDGATRFISLVWNGTLKSKYKVKYPNGARCPTNQSLRFFFYSDSVLAPGPTFTGYMRFRYKDA